MPRSSLSGGSPAGSGPSTGPSTRPLPSIANTCASAPASPCTVTYQWGAESGRSWSCWRCWPGTSTPSATAPLRSPADSSRAASASERAARSSMIGARKGSATMATRARAAITTPIGVSRFIALAR